MRKALFTVTVVFALQGVSSNAWALGPAAEMPAATNVASIELDKPRARLDEMQVQSADMRDAQEQKAARERQLASDFAKSKPVRVYFFFGGR